MGPRNTCQPRRQIGFVRELNVESEDTYDRSESELSPRAFDETVLETAWSDRGFELAANQAEGRVRDTPNPILWSQLGDAGAVELCGLQFCGIGVRRLRHMGQNSYGFPSLMFDPVP
jgi:hypothetical protein